MLVIWKYVFLDAEHLYDRPIPSIRPYKTEHLDIKLQVK